MLRRLCSDKEETINHIRSEVQDETLMGGKGDPLGIVYEREIWPYYQMVHVQTIIRPGEWDA